MAVVCQVGFFKDLFVTGCDCRHNIFWLDSQDRLTLLSATHMLVPNWCLMHAWQTLCSFCIDHYSSSIIVYYKPYHTVHHTFHTFGEPIVYIPTKFRKNILIRDRDMTPKKFDTGPLAAEFYSRFQFWQLSSFGDLPIYEPTKFHENRLTLGWVICNSTFSIPTFKPTLPTAQWHMPSCRPSIHRVQIKKCQFVISITFVKS